MGVGSIERAKMVSRILRRSGVAIVQVAEALDWVPDIVYQVGVGLNHEEVDVMKECWPNVKFVGFEPHPDTFQSLSPTYPGVLVQAAVGAAPGHGILHVKKHHRDGSSLVQLHTTDKDSSFDQIRVPIETLDGVVGQPTGKVLLWLDCEGWELQALQGAVQFIEGVEAVNVELTGKKLGDGWSDMADVHTWLLEREFFALMHHTQRMCSGQIDSVYVKPHLFKPELCSSPQALIEYRKWQRNGESSSS